MSKNNPITRGQGLYSLRQTYYKNCDETKFLFTLNRPRSREPVPDSDLGVLLFNMLKLLPEVDIEGFVRDKFTNDTLSLIHI